MARPVDRGTELWRTCLHEAAHHEVAKAFGWRTSRPRIHSAGRGHTPSSLPGGAVEFSPATAHRIVEKAVIDLAGPVAEAQYKTSPPGCSGDYRSAKDALRGTGTSFARARSLAATHVRRRWVAIHRLADDLYRNH